MRPKPIGPMSFPRRVGIFKEVCLRIAVVGETRSDFEICFYFSFFVYTICLYAFSSPHGLPDLVSGTLISISKLLY